MMAVFRKNFADSWKGLLGWIAAVVVLEGVYLPLHNSFADPATIDQIVKMMPKAWGDIIGYSQMATGPGYVQSTMWALVLFALCTIAAIMWGSRVSVADEESGQLDLVLAHGISRTSVLVQGTLAVIVKVLLMVAAATGMMLALNKSSSLDLTVSYTLQTASIFSLLILLEVITVIAVGAFFGRKTLATLLGAGVAIVGYVLNAIGNLQKDAQWLWEFSPYHWTFLGDPMTNGADGWSALKLAVCIVVLWVIGLLRFQRRDLGV